MTEAATTTTLALTEWNESAPAGWNVASNNGGVERSLNSLNKIVPSCACCAKKLLQSMRAICQECGAAVCARDATCRRAHEKVHLQEYYDKRARSMAQTGRVRYGAKQ